MKLKITISIIWLIIFFLNSFDPGLMYDDPVSRYIRIFVYCFLTLVVVGIVRIFKPKEIPFGLAGFLIILSIIYPIYEVSKYGTTFLLYKSAAFNHPKVVKILIPYSTQEEIDSALSFAVSGNNYEIAKELIDHRANAKLIENRETPIMESCKKSNVEMIKLLLDAGANPNVSDYSKQNCLMLFLDFGKVEKSAEILKLLIPKMDNLEEKDVDNETCLMKARKRNNKIAEELLIKAGSKE